MGIDYLELLAMILIPVALFFGGLPLIGWLCGDDEYISSFKTGLGIFITVSVPVSVVVALIWAVQYLCKAV